MKSPEISLSFCKIATAQCAATLLGALLWGGGVILGGFEMKIAIAGAIEAGILLVSSIVILLLLSPNKSRPVATVATLWSVTSFVRFIVALIASSLLYYVAQFGLRPLMFSFLLTAVLLLIAETKTLATLFSQCGSQTDE